MLLGEAQMAAQKYSIFFLLSVISSCAISDSSPEIQVDNLVEGCSSLSYKSIKLGDPVLLNLEVSGGSNDKDCPCKSALFSYQATQVYDGSNYELMSGHFTALNKENITLPVAAQQQLIFEGAPLNIRISCHT